MIEMNRNKRVSPNKRILRRLLPASLLSVLLVGCGGGGGGGEDPGNNPAPAPVLTGVLTDAVVSGVSYSTPTHSGTTSATGQFSYEAGETITFFIGDIQLGSVLAGPVITPLTLVGTSDPNNQQVINIVRLLLTLDFDGDPANGIAITAATRAAATGISIDFNMPTADFASDATVIALVAAAQTSNTALVDSAVAQTHLANTLASTWGLMEWGVGHWSAN